MPMLYHRECTLATMKDAISHTNDDAVTDTAVMVPTIYARPFVVLALLFKVPLKLPRKPLSPMAQPSKRRSAPSVSAALI